MSVVLPWALQPPSYPSGFWPTCSELSLTELLIFSSSTSSFGTAHTLLDYFPSVTLVRFAPNDDGSFDILPPLPSTAFTSTLVPQPRQRDSLLSVPQTALIWAYGIKWSEKQLQYRLSLERGFCFGTLSARFYRNISCLSSHLGPLSAACFKPRKLYYDC